MLGSGVSSNSKITILLMFLLTYNLKASKQKEQEETFGQIIESISKYIANSHDINKEINDLLYRHMAKQGQTEIMEGWFHPISEIDELVNKN